MKMGKKTDSTSKGQRLREKEGGKISRENYGKKKRVSGARKQNSTPAGRRAMSTGGKNYVEGRVHENRKEKAGKIKKQQAR